MSHDSGRRGACFATILIRCIHFEVPSLARGVTDTGVGSGALFDVFVATRSSANVTPRTIVQTKSGKGGFRIGVKESIASYTE